MLQDIWRGIRDAVHQAATGELVKACSPGSCRISSACEVGCPSGAGNSKPDDAVPQFASQDREIDPLEIQSEVKTLDGNFRWNTEKPLAKKKQSQNSRSMPSQQEILTLLHYRINEACEVESHLIDELVQLKPARIDLENKLAAKDAEVKHFWKQSKKAEEPLFSKDAKSNTMDGGSLDCSQESEPEETAAANETHPPRQMRNQQQMTELLKKSSQREVQIQFRARVRSYCLHDIHSNVDESELWTALLTYREPNEEHITDVQEQLDEVEQTHPCLVEWVRQEQAGLCALKSELRKREAELHTLADNASRMERWKRLGACLSKANGLVRRHCYQHALHAVDTSSACQTRSFEMAALSCQRTSQVAQEPQRDVEDTHSVARAPALSAKVTDNEVNQSLRRQSYCQSLVAGSASSEIERRRTVDVVAPGVPALLEVTTALRRSFYRQSIMIHSTSVQQLPQVNQAFRRSLYQQTVAPGSASCNPGRYSSADPALSSPAEPQAASPPLKPLLAAWKGLCPDPDSTSLAEPEAASPPLKPVLSAWRGCCTDPASPSPAEPKVLDESPSKVTKAIDVDTVDVWSDPEREQLVYLIRRSCFSQWCCIQKANEKTVHAILRQCYHFSSSAKG